MRFTRMIYTNPEDGYYHITSRIAFKLFVLNDGEKEQFVKLLRWLSHVYFVRIATYSIMSSHFHVVLQMIPSDKISDEELERRFHRYYNSGDPDKNIDRVFIEQEAWKYRKRWADLSVFVQDLKQRFSRWYNRRHDNQGTIWSSRFHSTMLESSRALLACMIYVDLNSIRAGLVARPEEYRYCGLSAYVTGGGASRWLYGEAFEEALTEIRRSYRMGLLKDSQNYRTRFSMFLHYYLEFVYRSGVGFAYNKGSIPDKIAEKALASKFAGSDILSFSRRIRYFTDGLIIGSKTFVEDKYREFRYYFQTEKEKEGHLIQSIRKKKKEVAPEDHVLHLHSIRRFWKD